MNEFISAGVALVVALGLWGAGKKPKKLFQNRFQTNNPSTSQYSLDEASEGYSTKDYYIKYSKALCNKPKTAKERIALIKELKKFISSGPDNRLLAIQAASEWGDPATIPILKLGLKDFDSRIVITAAEAISKFKNVTKAKEIPQKKNHPLNVSLMR